MKFNYDIIVVGAGHAGCEAAAAAANLGSKTLLITMNMNNIAQMSCNPSIGGIAKGQIVREIDALGGFMGIITDKTSLQFRMLNRSKGPAMWSPRAQCDRVKYSEEWRNVLENLDNLFIWQDHVSELIIKNKEVAGVKTDMGVSFYSKCVILSNGTFLNGLIHIGKIKAKGGRIAEFSSYGITEQLSAYNIKSHRFKTGTPVRIDGRSINFKELAAQQGENDYHKFSFLDTSKRILNQLNCWILYTNKECHDILRKELSNSPLYNGQIKGIGPRYCPSIESKITTFPDKESHQLFLEPEMGNSQEYYLNGFSSSLSIDIQIKALQSIPAFKNIQIYRPGYAIEYDIFDSTQLYHNLESKVIKNLFFAGQINGTTGYEEAGGQGLIAGVNAHLNCHGKENFILERNQAYIGILIDDLVTKRITEPYRMFTSRAEYRTFLRQDNADIRLTNEGYKIGLVNHNRYKLFQEKKKSIDDLISFIKSYSVNHQQINKLSDLFNTTSLTRNYKLINLISRPQLSLKLIEDFIFEIKEEINKRILNHNIREEIIDSIDIAIKYNGYIEREKEIANKINKFNNIKIENKFNYNNIQSLSTEARQKLSSINPKTINQAKEISGISPNDINILITLLRDCST
jgi:tRNA uridine 5-carboxymethylaminomethyl modification enzyme